MAVAERAELCLGLRQPTLVAIERGDFDAGTRETDSGGAADAAASAGDDGNAARQAEPVGGMLFGHGRLPRVLIMPAA